MPEEKVLQYWQTMVEAKAILNFDSFGCNLCQSTIYLSLTMQTFLSSTSGDAGVVGLALCAQPMLFVVLTSGL